MRNSIFISYRRDGGEALAQLLYDRLTAKGYSVFYDIEALRSIESSRSGPFDTKLYEKIEECDDFILILSPNVLEKCICNEDDFLRCEIRHALRKRKNIIPIIMSGFVWPQQTLPIDMDISRMNCISFAGTQFFKEKIEKLILQLVSTNPASQEGRTDSKGYAFISYSTKNQTSADAIRDLFKKYDIDTWMAPYNIPPGSKYAAVITKAIRECSCFVLLLSNDSQASEAVDSEVELAALTFKKSIITVEIEKVVLNDSFTFYIHNKQIIAVHKIDERSLEIKQLLDVVRTYTKNVQIDKSTESTKIEKDCADSKGSTLEKKDKAAAYAFLMEWVKNNGEQNESLITYEISNQCYLCYCDNELNVMYHVEHEGSYFSGSINLETYFFHLHFSKHIVYGHLCPTTYTHNSLLKEYTYQNLNDDDKEVLEELMVKFAKLAIDCCIRDLDIFLQVYFPSISMADLGFEAYLQN